MLNNHHIQTPDELFATHEDWLYSSLIDPKKEARMVEVFHEFSSVLYSKIADETDGKVLGAMFYTAEIRGFTLKMTKALNIMRMFESTIAFDEIFVGPKASIFPIPHFFDKEDENTEIIKWLDPCFRKFLYDLGWCCGILDDFEHNGKKIIVYQARKNEW